MTTADVLMDAFWGFRFSDVLFWIASSTHAHGGATFRLILNPWLFSLPSLLFPLLLPLLSCLPSLVSLRDYRWVGLLALRVPQDMTPGAFECSRVFGSSMCPASFPACDVLFLTAAVMSPAIGISRMVLYLVPFALLTDASGCYHMRLAFFTTTWELRGWSSLCEWLGLSF